LENQTLEDLAKSSNATAIAQLCEIMATFQGIISFHQKDKFSFLCTSTYQRQFGQRILIEYFLAISFIEFSHSIFQISLNQAEMIITLFINFLEHSIREFITKSEGIVITAISGIIGNKSIDS